MGERGTEETLRELVGEGPSWVAIGTVESIEEHDAWGYLLDLVLRSSGGEVQARLAAWGAGDRTGAWFPVAVGDEVLVLFPDGDPNRAVAVPGLPSEAARVPTGWNNDHVEIVHSGGMKVRTTDGATTSKVLLETMCSPLKNGLTEASAFMKAWGVPAPQLDALIAALPTSYRSGALETD